MKVKFYRKVHPPPHKEIQGKIKKFNIASTKRTLVYREQDFMTLQLSTCIDRMYCILSGKTFKLVIINLNSSAMTGQCAIPHNVC